MELLRIISIFSVVIPTMTICFIAAWDTKRISNLATLVSGAVIVALCGLGVVLCYRTSLSAEPVLGALLLACFIYYLLVNGLSIWQSVFMMANSVYLSCAILLVAEVVNSLTTGNPVYNSIGVVGIAVQWILVVVAIALLWYPARKAFPFCVKAAPRSFAWRYIWVLPAILFLGMLLFISSGNSLSWLDNGQEFYIIVSTVMQVIILIIAYMMGYRAIRRSAENEQLINDKRLLEIGMQRVQYVKDRIERVRRNRHDALHHIHVLEALLENGDVEAAQSYLQEMKVVWGQSKVVEYCGNTILNIFLSYYGGKSADMGADVRIAVDLPEDCGIPDSDLTVLFGNLLANAAKALELQQKDTEAGLVPPDREAYLHLIVQARSRNLFIVCDNSFSRKPRRTSSGALLSLSHDGLGVGTESIAAVAERYNGIAEFDFDDTSFHASVMLVMPGQARERHRNGKVV